MSQAEPQTPVAVIETDAFCEDCGFNLRTQKVWRDERLSISVCRCPECGRHHAAGMRTTAGSAWARRAALGGLVVWLIVQLAFVVGVFFSFVGFSAAASEGLISTDHMTLDGRPVLIRNATTTIFEFSLGEDQPYNLPASEVVYGRRLAPWLLGQPLKDGDYRFATPLQAASIAGIFAILTLAAGVAFASLSWYWRRGMKWLWLLLPALSTLFVITLVTQDYNRGRAWTGVPWSNSMVEAKLMAAVGVLIAITMAIGLAIGLPVARFVISVFIPPKSRQLFAFLWHCEGKTMPPNTGPSN
jgi:hypothetical protein